MVDRTARAKAAEVLRQFKDGLITNDEFEKKFPRNRQDNGLEAVRICVWNFYSDRFEHRLDGRYALRGEALKACERCLLFLKGDLEFGWPIVPKIGLRYVLIRLLGFGWVLRRAEDEQAKAGDVDVWPFLRKADYEEAISKQQAPKNT